MDTKSRSTAPGTAFQTQAYARLQRYAAQAEAERAAGRTPPRREAGLIPARNNACPCGSGRKFKVCCRKAQPYVG